MGPKRRGEAPLRRGKKVVSLPLTTKIKYICWNPIKNIKRAKIRSKVYRGFFVKRIKIVKKQIVTITKGKPTMVPLYFMVSKPQKETFFI
jgi:hypothetical protein